MSKVPPSHGQAASRKTRVIVVDDHPLVRGAIRHLLEGQTGFELCGESDNAAEAIGLVRQHKPQIAIVDITLTDTSGIELVKDIRAISPITRVIVASMHRETLYAERALRAGAMAYWSKESTCEQLMVALRQVAAGQVYVSPEQSSRIVSRMTQATANATNDPVDSLTDRELEVFQMIGAGLRTRDIADRLCLSIKTIETYRQNIKEKLDLQHATELVQRAVHWRLTGSGAMADPSPLASALSAADGALPDA